jgi:dolichol-phosphate mannosyltransferase
MKSNLRMLQVKIDRGRRFQGNSKMNNAKLIKYAFKFLSNFIDEIIYKIGLILILFWIVEIVSILMIIYIKFQTDLSIPGWTSLMVLLIFFSVVQLSIIYLTFILNYIKISDVSEKNQTNSVYSRIY